MNEDIKEIRNDITDINRSLDTRMLIYSVIFFVFVGVITVDLYRQMPILQDGVIKWLNAVTFALIGSGELLIAHMGITSAIDIYRIDHQKKKKVCFVKRNDLDFAKSELEEWLDNEIATAHAVWCIDCEFLNDCPPMKKDDTDDVIFCAMDAQEAAYRKVLEHIKVK